MRLLLRIAYAGWLACLLSATRVVSAPSVSFEQVLESIDRHYEGLHSLKADFTQIIQVPALEKSENFNGRLYFLKPHYLRLEYDNPGGQLLVADGTWYWFYMPQEDIPQAMRVSMAGGEKAPAYLLGGKMAERFTGRLLGVEKRGGVECYVLDLEPNSPSYYESLRAWVDKVSFATRAVRYIDEGGHFNTFDLSNLEENAPVSPARFNFTPPPGTQILDTE